MAIIRTTVLGGDDAPLAVTVDHDPTVTATDVPFGSLILATAGALAGCWYRKLTSGSNTNVVRVGDSKEGLPPFVAANDFTIPSCNNSLDVSGATTINRISPGESGLRFLLHFTGAPLVKHAQLSSATFRAIFLAGSADFQALADSRLLLWYDPDMVSNAITGAWMEIARTVA